MIAYGIVPVDPAILPIPPSPPPDEYERITANNELRTTSSSEVRVISGA